MRSAAVAVLVPIFVLSPQLRAQSSTEAPADEPSQNTPWIERLQLSGFVDAYYAHNFNQPADHTSFIPGTGSTAKRAQEFALNLVAVDLVVDPSPVGVHVTVGAGNGLDVIHSAEISGPGTSPDVWRHLYQATLSYRHRKESKLTIDGGVFPSHVGLEGFFSKDNWTYTRSWMGEFSPYYQTGVRATYQFSDRFSGQLHLLNGWQLIGDNNDGKTIGTQLAWNWERVSFSVNTLAGPELADDDSHWRSFLDTVLVVRPGKWIHFGASADVGYQTLPGDDSAQWWAGQALVRVMPAERLAVTLRGEYFSDPDAGITGASRRLVEGTLTVEFKPAERLILKLEGRYDESSQDDFSLSSLDGAGSPELGPRQTLVVLGAVATF